MNSWDYMGEEWREQPKAKGRMLGTLARKGWDKGRKPTKDTGKGTER